MTQKLTFLSTQKALIFSITWLSMAAQSQGRQSTFYYFELDPKEKLTLSLVADKVCQNELSKIKVEEFDSTKFYPSSANEGTVSVRIKNIFAEAIFPCSNQASGKIEKKVVVGPFEKQMTHIRLTVLDGIQVTSSISCGMMAPGTTFDIYCNLLPFTPPIMRQGDAVIEGEVTEVECGEKLQDAQIYFATIKVGKVISGKIQEPIKIKFTRYFDQRPRLGDNGVSFLPGEIAELTLTKYSNSWAVQFPFHKKNIRQSSSSLRSCP